MLNQDTTRGDFLTRPVARFKEPHRRAGDREKYALADNCKRVSQYIGTAPWGQVNIAAVNCQKKKKKETFWGYTFIVAGH